MHLSRKIPFSSHGHPNQLDPCMLGRISTHDFVRVICRTITDDDPSDGTDSLGHYRPESQFDILRLIPGRSNKHIRRSGHQLATLKKTKGNGGGVRLEIVWLCSCPHQSLAMARRDKCFGPSRSGSLAHLHLQRLSWRAIGKLAPCRRKETFGQRPLPAQVARKRQTHFGAHSVNAPALLSALGWGLHFTHRFLLEPMYDSCGPLPVP